MQDIVPAVSGAQKKRQAKPSAQVLRLQYKLPARLRRPIGQELNKIKHAGQRSQVGLGFERRQIRTEPPTSRPPSYRKNIGAEHHTGDVYMKSRPEIQITAPPYISTVARGGQTTKKEARLRGATGSVGRVEGFRQSTGGQTVKFTPTARQLKETGWLRGVRDAPYEFKRDAEDQKENHQQRDVTKNMNDLMVGVSAGTLNQEKDLNGEASWGLVQQPNGYLRRGGTDAKQVGWQMSKWTKLVWNRQVAFNAAVLVIGCVLAYGVVWNLNGLGRGWQVMGSVQERATQAYGRLISASAALAETDFSKSEADFSEAALLIHQAQGEMAAAMESSQSVLRWVDLTGTVRSGQEILAAGEQLSIAGGYIAQGVNELLGQMKNESFVEAVTGAKSEFAQAEEALTKAEKSFKQVDGLLLPPEVRAQLEKVGENIGRIRIALSAFNDRSDVLLAMLGAERDKQYLLLFQNNHEIRPTGGFIGSIGLINIDRGRVENIDINSVYDPDGQLKDYIEPPEPLKVVTNRWYLRDANWFVDYSVSARKVMEFFEKEGGSTVDGVIALTPEVVRELLKVTGPIQVPGYDVEVNYDNFWLVTQDQVSYSYDKELNQPKQFMADLAPVLLNRLLSGNTNGSLAALEGIMNMIEEKQLLVYLNNNEWQNKLTELGWSGDIPLDKPALLAVNNANIAGHKSDQFIEQEIDYRLEMMKDGTVEAVVMIKRAHRGDVEQQDYEYPVDENPATKDNVVYQRVLVPKGAKLLEAEGFASVADIPQMVEPETFTHMEADEDLVDWQTGQYQDESGTVVGGEAGYTFYANWVVTKPGKTSVVLYRYRLPEEADTPGIFNPARVFDVYVVKQPGDLRTTVRVQIDLPESMRVVHTVPEAGITQEGERTIIYRGKLRKDLLAGMVFARAVD